MKNLILILFLFFIYGCGYTSVYKNLEESNFQINLTEMLGDRDMNNLIKNQIDLYSNKNSVNKYNISVDTKYKRETLTKNSAGVISDYKISTISTFTIYIDDKIHKKTFKENINIKKQTNTFEQNLYENNVKINFASSIRDKLLTEIISIK